MKAIFIVGGKLLGLVLLVRLVEYATMIGFTLPAILNSSTKDAYSAWTPMLSIIMNGCAMATISWLLLRRTERIAAILGIRDEPSFAMPSAGELLMLGIQLIGIWMTVVGAVKCVDSVVQYTFTKFGHMAAGRMIGFGLQTVVGLLLTTRPQTIRRILEMKKA